MRKIVINKCHGGFSLSGAGMLRYAALKGVMLYPEAGQFGYATYWTGPKEERENQDNFQSMSMDARIASNKRIETQTISCRNFARDDPVLVQVVKELGAAADGACARLGITEIPDDVAWEIEEYDGKEWVAETHRTWS
jgi:hypothetical protein